VAFVTGLGCALVFLLGVEALNGAPANRGSAWERS
jgi:hypothetical protein